MTLGACVDAERVALRPFPVGSARTLRRRMSMRVCRTRGHVAAVATAVLDAGRRARLRHDWRSSAPARSAAPRLDSTPVPLGVDEFCAGGRIALRPSEEGDGLCWTCTPCAAAM